MKSQVSKLKTVAQKKVGVATLKSLCNAVWNRNKRTGVLGVLDNAHTFISSTIKGSDKIKTSEIQAVIDSLSKKDYHKGFEESYSRINDVATFDSSNNKLTGNMSINIIGLKKEAENYANETKQIMERHKSKITEENISAKDTIREYKNIAKTREKELKVKLSSLGKYCECDGNDGNTMEYLTEVAKCIFSLEILKHLPDSVVIFGDSKKGGKVAIGVIGGVILALCYLLIAYGPLGVIVGVIIGVAFLLFTIFGIIFA